VPLNSAEGCAEFSRAEKVRFYRMARRSAAECVAALDLVEALGFAPSGELESARDLLDRTIAMLTVLKKPPAPAPAPAPAPHVATGGGM
jgi:four helix bundle protein